MTDPHGPEECTAERVLVVASEAVLRDVLRQDLEDMGFDVESVASATDGLRALARSSFSVAFVEAAVEQPGARVVLAAGRAWRPGLQCVLLVPFAGDAKLGDAMALSPFACLRIPFSPEELEAVTRLAIRHRVLLPEAEPCRSREALAAPEPAVESRNVLLFGPRTSHHGAEARENV